MNFASPTSIILSGVSGSGKTTFLFRLLDENLFDAPPSRIYYFYGTWQPAFNNRENIEFFEGLPQSFENLYDGNHNIIVLDDLQTDVTKSSAVENLFTRGSHHKNFTIIYLNQNLFYQGKSSRTISVNAHYTILFRNPRAASQIQTLATQTGLKHLPEAFHDATTHYRYLVVDLNPNTEREYALRTNIFKGEDPIIYH